MVTLYYNMGTVISRGKHGVVRQRSAQILCFIFMQGKYITCGSVNHHRHYQPIAGYCGVYMFTSAKVRLCSISCLLQALLTVISSSDILQYCVLIRAIFSFSCFPLPPLKQLLQYQCGSDTVMYSNYTIACEDCMLGCI